MFRISSRILLLGVGLVALTLTALRPGWAQSSDALYRSSPLGLYPPNIGFGASGPMVMLTASKDHTLFSPIYTDYEDIDGDGTDDFTFKPTYTYYGYFDATKCYAYDAGHAAGARFEPVAMADASGGFQSCLGSTTGRWSGNFLNWATMTRIDVVRKTLYGGKRVEDSASDTTIEMAQMATDAHSFVKYYSGSDLKHFTPFDQATDMGNEGLTICNRGSDYLGFAGFPMMRLAKGNYSLWATIRGEVCNWREERSSGDQYFFGEKIRKFYDKYGPSRGAYLDTQKGDPTSHKVELPTQTNLSGVSAELAVRVQVCKPNLMGKERCKAYGSGTQEVYKPIGLLQEFAATEADARPARAEFGLITGSYDSNLKGGFLRKNMGSVNDELDRSTGQFCHRLSSDELSAAGSRCKTTSGIVRAFDQIRLYSAGDYNNALQPGADRTGVPNVEFLRPQDLVNGDHASWGNPMSEMIVQALAYFAGDAVAAQTILGMPKTAATGRDKEVGLPSDVVVRDPLDDTDASIDPASGLVRSKLYGKGMCRPMHVLAISSGTVSFDTDEAGSNDDIYGTVTPFFSRIKSTDTLAALTHQVGDNEGISNSSRSVGSVSAGFGQDCTVKGIGKLVTDGLAQVAGVCPEAPGIKGSYLGAGAALAANTRAIRPVDNDTVSVGGTTLASNKLPSHALRVKTYAASLAGGVARIEVPVGDTGKKVYITPESSWRHAGYSSSDTLMPGAMLTFRALDVGQDPTNPKRRFGSYVVTWNDAQFGGDYDEDLTGFIRWEIAPMASDPSAYELKILTDVFAMSAGAQGSHGFSIIGVDKPLTNEYKGEGRYLTHGANGFASVSECKTHGAASDQDAYLRLCSFDNDGMYTGTAAGYDGYVWPTAFKGATVDFVEKGGLSTTVVSKFKVTTGTDGVTLRDPLWYIAKYGSFDTGEKPNEFKPSVDALPEKVTTPGTSSNWDRQDNANPDCVGAACADGEPDGYFLARRPELLEARLRQLLGNIAANSNAAPAVSATQLLVGKLKFQSEFTRNEFSGTVKAFELTKQGVFASTPLWDAGKQMEVAGSGNRRVITNFAQVGVLFTDEMFSGDGGPVYLNALLGLSPTATATTTQLDQAKTLVNYLRGSRAAEDAKLLRARGTKDQGIMGPVVSSTPWVQDHEFAARFSDGVFPSGVPSYRAFIADKAKSDSLVWVGSNDGMLHGMKVSDGSPVLSYVPSPLVGRLSTALSAQNSEDVALMDGSPFTADVLVPSSGGTGAQAWRTYLFSSLGRGGRALFALDVTANASAEGGLKGKAPDAVFRWVFTAEDDAWAPANATPASDLGYNVQDPVKHPASDQPTPVVYLNDGNFWLLHPNGHRSDSGRAVLFLFKMTGPGAAPWRDAVTGATNGYAKLATRASDTNNGLMGVTWVDLDNNKTADLVYGTDLKGQLWRFDLRDKDPNNWRVGLYDPAATGAALAKEGTPLFTAKDSAGNPLPIMSAPAATFPSYGGVMLSFGTGLALESGDFPDVSRTQRFFTVWDRGGYVGDRTFAVPKVLDEQTQTMVDRPNPLPDLARLTTNQAGADVKTFIERFAFRDSAGNVFLAQTTAEGAVVTDGDGKPVPLGPVNSAPRFDPAIHDGWFFEFPDGGAQGEAVLSSPGVRSNFVFFTSVRGQTTQEQEQACSQQPSSTLYALSPVNGLPVNSLLVNGAYYLGTPVNDQKLIIVRDRTGDAGQGGGSQTGGEGGSDPGDPPGGGCSGGTVAVRVLGGAGGTSQRLCVPATSLRIMWRELPGLRTQ